MRYNFEFMYKMQPKVITKCTW